MPGSKYEHKSGMII